MKLPIHTVVDRDGNEHTFDERADDASYWFEYDENDKLSVRKSGEGGPNVVAEFYQPIQRRIIWD